MGHVFAPARRSVIAALAASSTVAFPGASVAQSNSSRVVLKRLTWAGVRIERGETALYVDAVAPSPEDRADAFDPASDRPRKYAVVTHGHGDHFDIEFLRSVLGERGVIFCHRDTLGDIDSRSLRVQAVDMWEPVFMPRSGADIVGFAAPAVDGFGLSQVSWVLRCGDKRIIHCGDTLWHGEWWDIGASFGPFDVACLPINAARQNLGRFQDVGVPGVMTPQQAAAAARALNARVIVPIHYGHTESGPTYVEVGNALDALRAEAARLRIEVRALAQGEEMTL